MTDRLTVLAAVMRTNVLVVSCYSFFLVHVHSTVRSFPLTTYKPEQVNPKLGFDAASTFLHKLTLGFPFCPKMLMFLVSNP